jgi:hypothetical protein
LCETGELPFLYFHIYIIAAQAGEGAIAFETSVFPYVKGVESLVTEMSIVAELGNVGMLLSSETPIQRISMEF